MKKRTLAFLLAFVMILGCFAGLGAGVLNEDVDFADLSVEEQYSVLMSLESDEDTMALFATLNEEQQAALSAYADAQLDETDAQEDDDAQEDTVAPVTESYPAPAVNFTNVAPFVKHNSSPAKARMLAKAAGQTTKGKAPEGIKLKKTATPNDDGTYTITLEAYATGEKIITEVKNDVPTDIVLVLDQSGSMADDMGTVQYTQYSGTNTQNNRNYEKRHNGGSANLWHKLDDGSYVSVSVTRQETAEYNKITNGRNDSDRDGYTNLWDNRDNLYTYVNGERKKVVYTRDRDYFWEDYNCKYALEDGTILNENNNGPRHSPTFKNTDDGYLYLRTVKSVYTYTYTDSNGNVQTIGISTGANERFAPAFYQRTVSTSGGGTRLDALKKAAKAFVEAVNEKAKGADKVYGGDDDVDHRIAIVGFSSNGYNNTELLTGSTITQGRDYFGTEPSTYYSYYFPTGYEMNGPQYGNITDAQYKNALQQVKTAAGFDNVKDGIEALTAYGGTMTQDGLDMANKIFEQNPLGENEKRNRVVVVFTDGVPGLSGYDSTVAGSAIEKANTAKNTYSATVYTIGIFSGADATSAGDNSNGASETQKANWFMQNVSSNNGTVQNPSYYLSAGDSASLSEIFKQISDQIEEGGSSTTLDSKTVIRDIISQQFALPDGATVDNIKLETYACTGKDNNGNYTWKNNNSVMGAKATIASTDDTHETTKNNQVNVTGFDFKENYVGTVTENGTTTYRGNKLVISFVVEPRDGFLGGNDVVTNTSAGVYENDSAKEPVGVFDQPQVDVKIKEPTLTAPDANVYLGANYEQTVSSEELKKDTTIKFGDNIVLDMTKPNDNWGLEDWQTEYVNIEVKITDKDGNPVENSEKLTDDTEYKISVSVTPITPKDDNNGYTKDAAGNIHVFKPVLTFKDSTAYYGEAAATDFSANFVSENWKHGDMAHNDSNVKMLGEKPKLNISYAMDNSELVDNLYYGNEDVHVKATVSINGEDVTEFTTFEHQNCNEEAWTATGGNPAFVIHIKTCTLTVKKSVAETYGNNDSFIFKVVGKGNVPYEAQVVITGNDSATLTGLPVGDYTVTEDTAWSWRYKTDNSTASTTLSSAKARGEVIITNKLNENRWLGDETLAINKCVKNEESSIIKIFMNLLGLD